MKKVNLILSVISLTVTSFLIVLIIFAWYATNKTANVSAGIGHTKGTDYDLTLQRGEYSAGNWRWTDTNELSIDNLQPGDCYYFRFKIDYDARVVFETSFSEITSSLVENKVVVVTSNGRTCVQINGTGLNWFEVSNNSVSIVEYVGNTPQTAKQLYSISAGVVSLNTTNYNVADTFKLYDYGLGTVEFSNDNVLSLTDLKESGGTITSTNLTSNPTIRYDLSGLASASGEAYGYFALEFNDELSTKRYLHLDNTISSDSNIYQCQAMTIGAIALREIS